MGFVSTILAALRWRASQEAVTPTVWPTYRLRVDTETAHRARVNSETVHRARVDSDVTHRVRVDAQ